MYSRPYLYRIKNGCTSDIELQFERTYPNLGITRSDEIYKLLSTRAIVVTRFEIHHNTATEKKKQNRHHPITFTLLIIQHYIISQYYIMSALIVTRGFFSRQTIGKFKWKLCYIVDCTSTVTLIRSLNPKYVSVTTTQ